MPKSFSRNREEARGGNLGAGLWSRDEAFECVLNVFSSSDIEVLLIELIVMCSLISNVHYFNIS